MKVWKTVPHMRDGSIESKNFRHPLTVNRQPSTANRQPPTVNRQPSTTNRQPPTKKL